MKTEPMNQILPSHGDVLTLRRAVGTVDLVAPLIVDCIDRGKMSVQAKTSNGSPIDLSAATIFKNYLRVLDRDAEDLKAYYWPDFR